MKISRLSAAAAAATLAIAGVAFTGPAEAHTTRIHDNCTNFNKTYPHGVGRRGANDRGGNVTNFRRSNDIYNTAERHNGDLDRDNDRIACEKA
ncbi:MAG: hypothetical protein WKF79_01630 [Nocardioides sp.]